MHDTTAATPSAATTATSTSPPSAPFAAAELAADVLTDRLGLTAPPRVAVVCGSGLGQLADSLDELRSTPMADVAGFVAPTVPGHAGLVATGLAGATPVLVFSGRCHLYEGHDPNTVVHSVRTAAALGVRTVVLTNAAGGVSPTLGVGSLVAIADHLNLTGANPLAGTLDSTASRFCDLSGLYSTRVRSIASSVAARSGLELAQGVYAALAGPSYETPAEVRMVAALGADLVGMSTVLEAIAAHHAGLEVAGFSLVTNHAAGIAGPLSHDEVTEVGAARAEAVSQFLVSLCAAL